MRAKLVGLLALVAVFLGLAFAIRSLDSPAATPLSNPTKLRSEMTLISHAGAGLPVGAYSNSQQALERAQGDGLGLIEVDFSWTSDGSLVLLHSWGGGLGAWFDLPLLYKVKRKISGKELPLSQAAFLDLTMRSSLTQMSLDQLLDWLGRHLEVRIVTDAKTDNIAALALIAQAFPDAPKRIIPQIYSFEEYDKVRALGYQDIIFTGYRSAASNAEIVAFASSHKLLAVTLPQARLTQTGLAELAELAAPLWTHTINDPEVAERLSRAGVAGVYTDILLPF